MRAPWTTGLALAALALSFQPAAAADAAAAWAGLPDWSGVWGMVGNTVFDRATVVPPNAGAGVTLGAREHPPYNAQWEARYVKNIAGVTDGTFPDPATFCGIPIGMPRMVNSPDGYEWVVTPKQVWMLTENSMGVRRIYTDGRKHPADPGHTYTGHAIGHWEGDTLVVDTVGMRAESIVDRTGLQLSDQRHIVERIRKVDPTTLEDQITIEDPLALIAPWKVTKRFRLQPKGTYIFDYACAENNRNPVDENGRTITTDSAGKVIAN
ncbi:MAG TPA: hypothetical protein VL460_00740 [Caulobacteraceae bacterium]|jgi:hypothetical protein|nr:hypothetical protein [Caulobacteraceae bacterium]